MATDTPVTSGDSLISDLVRGARMHKVAQSPAAAVTLPLMDMADDKGITEVEKVSSIDNGVELNQPDDLKYVSDLSTLLVATIQDAKDRISQVEYVFCSQLYPTFQKNSNSLQKLYLEVRKATEDKWKETHLKMVNQMDELYLEKKQILADKADLMRKISELEEKLLFKDVEIEKGKEVHYKLQQVIESKSSDLNNKQRLLGLYEERLSSLFTNMKELEKEKCQLKEELGKNNEDESNGKELQKEILKYVSSQGKKILRMEELLQCKEKERKSLVLKLENVEASYNDLTSKYGMRTIDLEKCRKLQEQLVQQNDVNLAELKNKEQLLSTHEKEKTLLLSRLKDLENKIEELQESAKDRNAVIPERSEHYRHLVQRLESKDSELLTEKQKRKDLLSAYKSLKSQYNYLCVRSGLTAENMTPKPKVEVENEPHSASANNNSTSVCNMVAGETTKVKEISSSGNSEEENNARSDQTADAVGKTIKVKKEMMSESTSDDDENGTRLNQASVFDAASKWKTSRNSSSLTGGKRPTSDWRETRSRQGPNGPDPHDDFLDTPLENIRGNLNKALREEVHNIPAPVSRDMECDDSDDETQANIDAEPVLQKQQHPPQVSKRSPNEFKFVEPVRKKAQREALKGIECKQCKKFYDAVLPDGEDKDAGDGKKGFRCEHLDGVSRHRYRYAPPMTPEGFWNIGFDSDI